MLSTSITTKTIISAYSDNGWFGSNYKMNIYRGCNHGCIYCDSRSSCYQIEEFDTIKIKSNALQIIECELKSKRKKGIVMTGSMSDPYNPVEEDLCLTRGALELINKYHFGVIINTKSNLICRDLDILEKIKEHSPVAVNVTITTSDDCLSKKLEPNVCSTKERFKVISKIADRNITSGIILMPILPYINDSTENIIELIELAERTKAKWIYPGNYFGVTLREGQRGYFYKHLDDLFPGLKQQYIASFGSQKEGISPNNIILTKVFKDHCLKKGLLSDMNDIICLIKKGYGFNQLSLL